MDERVPSRSPLVRGTRERRVGTPWWKLLALGLLPFATGIAACGRKTDPKPPELVAPKPVGELALASRPDGVALRWSRPTEYVDGSTMEDLGGFLIERSRYNSRFTELTRVPVTDRGRFQKVKRFEYLDREVLENAAYHYRIVAFTTDGYYSAESGVATIVWSPPQPTATPKPTPAASR